MGCFEDHMRYGVAFYVGAVLLAGAGVVYLFLDGVVDARGVVALGAAAVLGFPFALAGAGFPDVDHGDAKPHRYLKKWLALVAGSAAAYLLFVSSLAREAGADAVAEAGLEAPEPALAGGAAVVGGIAAGVVARVAVDVLKPKHRGVTHTLGAGFVVAALVGAGVGYAGWLVAPFVGFGGEAGLFVGGVAATAFFVGFLSHLQCDGLLIGFLPDRTA